MIHRMPLRWLRFVAAGISLSVAMGIVGIAVRDTAAHQLLRYVDTRDRRIAHHVAHAVGVANRRGGWPLIKQVAEQTADQLGVGIVLHIAEGRRIVRIPPLPSSKITPASVTVPLVVRRGWSAR